MKTIDPHLLQTLQTLLKNQTKTKQNPITPLTDVHFSGSEEDIILGKKLIQEGKVGCLLLAGGQGTRLRFDQPKGFFPISVIKNKSLFQLVCEKVEAAGHSLPFAVMTSPESADAVYKYFEKNRWHAEFFSQDTLPLLNHEGEPFLETENSYSVGPDGNGSALHLLVKSGIFDKWRKRGVEYIQCLLIDNPLSDPFDPEWVGFHARKKAEVVIKAIKNDRPEEKVGVLAKSDSNVCVVEYTERPDSTTPYPYANLSLLSFSASFVQKASDYFEKMPLHIAHKAAKYLNQKGETVLAQKPNAWKFERFIFDVLPFANRVETLVYPREECFAPLKNESDISKVKAALQEKDRRIFRQVFHATPPSHPFELDPKFGFLTPERVDKWKNRKPIFDHGYLSAEI
ncbi:MAG: UTP--glucose-1-phosphate uridylyltransferase [Waddliaceae bacterium]